MQKITPFLWFDHQAEDAVNMYVSLFEDSRILEVSRYPAEAPFPGMAGTVMTAVFQLAGRRFMALNGGPRFQPTPAVSFFASCRSGDEVDTLFETLAAGGSVLMPLQAYPWSERYAWVQDRYGVSWQLTVAPGIERQTITPALLFSGKQTGRAAEAMQYYVSLFEHSRVLQAERYGRGEQGTEGHVKYGAFVLHGQEFIAMDSGVEGLSTFTEATSFLVDCRTQDEVDRFWKRLSEDGETQRCGWLKDRFGVSWQIIPSVLGTLLRDPDPKKAKSVMDAMLQMTRIDIAALQQASEQAGSLKPRA